MKNLGMTYLLRGCLGRVIAPAVDSATGISVRSSTPILELKSRTLLPPGQRASFTTKTNLVSARSIIHKPDLLNLSNKLQSQCQSSSCIRHLSVASASQTRSQTHRPAISHNWHKKEGIYRIGQQYQHKRGVGTEVTASNNMASLSHIPEIEQLSPTVWRVLGCNPGPYTLQGTNTYIVGTGENRILIDAGDAGVNEYVRNLQKILSEQKIKIDQIIITHWHHDHLGGVPDVVDNIPDCPRTVWKVRRVSQKDENIGKNISYSFIEDGHVFKTEGATLRAIYTPGHSDDHICLHLEEDNIVFSGDTVLGEGTAVFEDLYDYMKSLDKILSMKSSTVYPSHGSVVTDPESHISMYINHRNARERQILECIKANSKPLKGMEIVKIVYHDVPEHLHPGALNNVKHHLSKLVKEKLVEVATNDGDEDVYGVPKSQL